MRISPRFRAVPSEISSCVNLAACSLGFAASSLGALQGVALFNRTDDRQRQAGLRIIHFNCWYIASCALGGALSWVDLKYSFTKASTWYRIGDRCSYLCLGLGASFRLYHEGKEYLSSRRGEEPLLWLGVGIGATSLEVIGATLVTLTGHDWSTRVLAVIVPALRIIGFAAIWKNFVFNSNISRHLGSSLVEE